MSDFKGTFNPSRAYRLLDFRNPLYPSRACRTPDSELVEWCTLHTRLRLWELSGQHARGDASRDSTREETQDYILDYITIIITIHTIIILSIRVATLTQAHQKTARGRVRGHSAAVFSIRRCGCAWHHGGLKDAERLAFQESV